MSLTQGIARGTHTITHEQSQRGAFYFDRANFKYSVRQGRNHAQFIGSEEFALIFKTEDFDVQYLYKRTRTNRETH